MREQRTKTGYLEDKRGCSEEHVAGRAVSVCGGLVLFPPQLPSVLWMNKDMGKGRLETSCLVLNKTSDLKQNICIYQMGS